MLKLLSTTKIQLLIIVILTFAAYSNIFQNEFVIDDKAIFLEWDLLRDPKNIPKFFTREGLLEGTPPVGYRPVRTSLMALVYQISGTNPWGYHLVSILIHLANTLLVYLIIIVILERSSARRGGAIESRDQKRSYRFPAVAGSLQDDKLPTTHYLPFIAALLFGLHPIHTEVVSFISASFDMFGFAFFLGSMFLYLKVKEPIGADFNRFALTASWILAGLAFFTYEATLILPFVLILWEICFGRLRSVILRPKAEESKKILRFAQDDKLSKKALSIAPYFALVAFYLFVRFAIVHVTSRGSSYFGVGPDILFLTSIKAFWQYIALLIAPLNLSLDPYVEKDIYSHTDSWILVDKLRQQSLFDLNNLLPILLIILLILIAIKFVRKMPLVTFAIGWFFVTFLPVSNIVLVGVIMQERYVYLASVGFVLILSYLGHLSYLSKKLVLAIFFALVVFYGIRTYQRNRDWQNDLVLNKSVSESSPFNYGQHYNLGVKYHNIGQYDLAAKAYWKAIGANGNFWQAYYNLAGISLIEGKKNLAITLYQKTLDLNPQYLPAQNVLKNLPLIKTGSNLAHFQSKNNNLGFDFPAYWSLEEERETIVLKDSKSDFTLEIKQDQKPSYVSLENYLQTQTQTYGQLESQGLAQIPGFDKAYVKVWKAQRVLMQFFLFKGTSVVKTLVYPVSSNMRELESILGTMKTE